VSPSQASPQTILAVDLYGTAVVLEEFGDIIARGGSWVVIASQSGHRLGALTAEQDAALATTPADELLALPMLQPDQVTDSLHSEPRSRSRGASALPRPVIDSSWSVCSGRRSLPGHEDLREGSASEAFLFDEVKLQVLI
jgi:hypothetical protein